MSTPPPDPFPPNQPGPFGQPGQPGHPGPSAPPPGYGPPPGFGQQGFGQQGFGQQQPPPGYQAFGGQGLQPAPQGNNGLSIASMVLSLVNIIPCFWFFPITAVLGVIFGFVARGQMRNNPGQRGRGMAIAGIVVGLVFIAIAAIFWIYIATSDNCYRDGNSFRCGDLN